MHFLTILREPRNCNSVGIHLINETEDLGAALTCTCLHMRCSIAVAVYQLLYAASSLFIFNPKGKKETLKTKMKKFWLLSTLACGCFISNAAAESNEAYQLADRQLKRVNELTKNLTEAISDWDGTDLQASFSNIHLPSVSLAEYITNATGLLREQQAVLDNTQSFKIGTPAQRLAYAVNASIATLIRRKDDFDAASIGVIVIDDLTSLMTASRNFSQALTSLVPQSLQPVAVNLETQNIGSLQQGIDCFNGAASACSETIVDPNRTFELAVRYNAMKRDGSPFI